LHLRTLFADDATRGERLTAEAVGIYFDYSKNRITDETIALLCGLAEESGLREPHRRHVPRRQDQRDGKPGRPPCRLARATRTSIVVDGKDVVPEVSRRTRCDGRLFDPGPERRVDGHTGKRIRMSSTSASAAPTSARSWRMRRSSTTASAR